MGGGHAHLQVLADLAARPLPGAEVALVSPSAWHHYSGMVPGFLQGRYAEADLTIDLASLAARARVRLVEAMAERIDASRRTVDAGGERLPFDVLSLDVGAAPAGLDEALGALVELATPERASEYRVGLQNFYVLTRYNRSAFYASAVAELAEALRKNQDGR